MCAVPSWFSLRDLSSRAIVLSVVSAAIVCAAALGWLGWRLVEQDEALAVQRAQEGLEAAADLAVASFSRSLLAVDTELASWLNRTDVSAGGSPLFSDMTRDGTAVLVTVRSARVIPVPAGRLLFDPVEGRNEGPAAEAAPLAALFARGDRLEFIRRDFAGAAREFARLAAATSGDPRAAALVRRARAERKAGLANAALSTYAALVGMPEAAVEGRPARLLARHATCALLEAGRRQRELEQAAAAFHGDLYSGRWLVPRALFEVYARDAARWHPNAVVPPSDRERIDARMRLTNAVVWLLASRREGGSATAVAGSASAWIDEQPLLVAWRAAGDGLAAVVLDPRLVEAYRSADLAAALTRAQARLVLSDPAGHLVAGDAPPPRVPVATRESAQVALPWTVRVVAAEATGLLGHSRTRRSVAIAGFVVMALVLVGGSYAAARAIVRELSAVRVQSEFVATVSHEFRTPLAAIRHVSDLLVEGRVKDDNRRQRYYQALQAESERLQRLVETLLDFRRLEDGARPYRMEACQPTVLLADVADRFRIEAARRGYELELAISPDLPRIMADGAALGLALWNLLDNAVKYSPSCKTVRLEARAEGNGVAILVADRGLGIAKHEERRVFARFVRGASAAASGAGGTGLGLAIVRHIVDAHRGTVALESAPESGTTFIIRIPRFGGAASS